MSEQRTEGLVEAAEAEWLDLWQAGPSRDIGLLPVGAAAPDLELLDDAGVPVSLSSFWEDGPALLMFWRHFGCGCGVDRAARLESEFADYVGAGLNPVVIGQGEPARAAAYRDQYRVPCPILCDPEHTAYHAYGLGDFAVEQVLYDAPEDMWGHTTEIGIDFQAARRQMGRPLVDNPWTAPGEFVVDTAGTIRVSYTYQFCENFPDPRIFTTAVKRLAS